MPENYQSPPTTDTAYHSIFDGLLLPILLVDEHRCLIQFNKYAADILQLTASLHLGQDVTQIFPWLANKLHLSETASVDYAESITTSEGERQVAIRVAALSASRSHDLIITLHDETEQRQTEEALRFTQERLFDFIEFLPDSTFAIDRDGRVTVWNRAMELLTGTTKAEMLGQNYLAYSALFWGKSQITLADMVLQGTMPLDPNSPYRELRLEGETLFAECHAPALNQGRGAYVWLKAAPLYDRTGNIIGALETVRDITQQQQALLALQASEQRLRFITDHLLDIVCEIDPRGTLLYVSPSSQQVIGYAPEQLIGRPALLLAHPDDRVRIAEKLELARKSRVHGRLEFRCVTAQGNYFWAEAVANAIYDQQQELLQVVLAVRDITSRKALEEKLTFLSWHDSLTKIYNRGYWQRRLGEIEAARLTPVSVLLCDVDGLKLINDTMGHDAGDQMLITLANILAESCGTEDILARIGGDELAMLLPHTSREKVLAISQQIRDSIVAYNHSNQALPLSVSIGIAVRIDADEPMAALIKRADDRMYREKLNRSHSIRHSLVQALSLALEARDFGTEGHTLRVQQLATRLATKLGMPETQLNDLRLLALFHDVGKVGTPDYILHKPGPLTDSERQEMQRHPEIGHRIALASPDLTPIADLILHHHEWWNGAGYPSGLKEEEIPLACRILAIVDAYDAMTSDRPYRQAMEQALAIEELRRYAGTQFDPYLVPIFIDLIEEPVCNLLH